MNRVVRQFVPAGFTGELVLEQTNNHLLIKVGESASIHENSWYNYMHWILVMFSKGTLEEKTIALDAADWVDDFKYSKIVAMDKCYSNQERYRTVVDVSTMNIETEFLQIVLE